MLGAFIGNTAASATLSGTSMSTPAVAGLIAYFISTWSVALLSPDFDFRTEFLRLIGVTHLPPRWLQHSLKLRHRTRSKDSRMVRSTSSQETAVNSTILVSTGVSPVNTRHLLHPSPTPLLLHLKLLLPLLLPRTPLTTRTSSIRTKLECNKLLK